MDWGNVTAEDLMDALREVEWSSPPRPAAEFFSRFTVPRSYSKWNSRLKCNLYYYRTNYFFVIVFVLGIGFIQKPLAIIAAILTGLGIAFLNDSFAVTFNEKVTRTVRQFSPHLAAKMRPTISWEHCSCLLFVGGHLQKEQFMYVGCLVGCLSLYSWQPAAFCGLPLVTSLLFCGRLLLVFLI